MFLRFSRAIRIVSLCALGALVLPSCKTEQKITTKSMRYAIDQGAWEKSGASDDTDEIKAKFGTSYAEAFGEDGDGSGAKRSSLENKMFNHRGGDLAKKEFRGSREFGEVSEYKTPEFLRRQEFINRQGEAREGGQLSRYGQVNFAGADDAFRGGDEEMTFWQKLNPFRKSRSRPAREADQMFSADDYKTGNRALADAPTPVPVSSFGEGLGDYRDSSVSMDDVRKMLSPEAFR